MLGNPPCPLPHRLHRRRPQAGSASARRGWPGAFAPSDPSDRGSRSVAPVIAVLALVGLLALLVASVIGPAIASRLLPQSPSVEAGRMPGSPFPRAPSGDTIDICARRRPRHREPQGLLRRRRPARRGHVHQARGLPFKTGQDPCRSRSAARGRSEHRGEEARRPRGPNRRADGSQRRGGMVFPQTSSSVAPRRLNYVDEYPYLEGAYDDSRRRLLYPKTYNLGENPSADDVIRALLDQFEAEDPATSTSRRAPTGWICCS